MNVLIFVMTMLMLLSLITYARLETYRSSQTFQIIFKHYMQEDERGYINVQAEKNYKNIKVTEKEAKDGKKNTPKKIDASPRIGIGLLFNAERDAKGKEWEQTKVLLKNLMRTLYKGQGFYDDLEARRPNFVDDLVPAITRAIDELPKDVRPKYAEGLGNLELSDRQLNSVLYKMLHGAKYVDVLTDEQRRKLEGQNGVAGNDKLSEAEVEAVSNEEESSDDADEYKSPEGYFSLLDFVNSGSKPKIRVYLAPKEVLQAIFNEPGTVNSVVEERQRLYRQADADGSIEQLSESFKNQFMKLKDPSIEDETLNFTISKTNPKYYK